MPLWDRRQFVQALTLASAATLLEPSLQARPAFPIRQITRGPRHHWFGYYDKDQFDPSNRYVLGMEVDFEGRSPAPDDEIRVGMIDLADKQKWIDLGSSRAWNWQQGCMLQWRPNSATELVWNDREQGRFVSRLMDARSGQVRTLPSPVYALAPDGRTAVTLDFERLQDMRPGYGYPGVSDARSGSLAPEDRGIYRLDLETGKRELIVSVAAARSSTDDPRMREAKHYFNHLLVNPDGSRFAFLHRWRFTEEGQYSSVGGFGTRMLTAALDGSDVRVVDASGYTSHFVWRDSSHILAWTRPSDREDGFYLLDEKSGEAEPVGQNVMTRNGHCSYLPGNEWILNDTYPDEEGNQKLYLYNVGSRDIIELGEFFSPDSYRGEWRVDLHPRSSRDGGQIVIDSAHGGQGRQMYLVDIEFLVG